MKKFFALACLLSMAATGAFAQSPAQEDRLDSLIKDLKEQVDRLKKIENITSKDKWYCSLDTAQTVIGTSAKPQIIDSSASSKLKATNDILKQCRESYNHFVDRICDQDKIVCEKSDEE